MALNKKGIFFTIMAILLISIFVFSFTLFSVVKERGTIKKRVETLNNFVVTVEEDLQRKLFIAGFRIIFLFEKNVIESGEYVSNLNDTFEEVFYNGTLYGNAESLMNYAKYSDIINSLKEKAGKVNANLTITNPQISVTQDNPWNVKIIFSGNMVLKDLGGLVGWNRTINIDSYVPIEGFGDPLYAVYTNSLIFNNITETPYINFVDGSDISNLSLHLENSFYIASSSAPSFLDRLQGINAPNSNGIESLVNLDRLADAGISVRQKSVVDYVYFSSSNPSFCQVNGMPSWFLLDNENGHFVTYQVQDLVFNCQ